ncbi:MAG TPA: TIGR03936 family radical SAM-associated protein, partial [candidate division Zixibacteria bacterium]|nr:TIGR03936 family radical SAM-associated protein [candidate division Zixibacteria bacterium]
VNLKHPLTEMSYVQGLIGRGGREMAPVILSAYKKGCRFDSWNEDFRYGAWQEAFAENRIDVDQLAKPIPFSADLPWSHITKGISVDHLKEERERTSMQLRDYVPAAVDDSNAKSGPEVEYGRGKKKMASRSTVAPTKNHLRIRWSKSSRYRYMSHLDNLRLIERAIRRAHLPVQFSQGFNPSMKLSFGPPLPLGFTSEAEFVDITLETNFMMYMLDNLKKTFPEGIEVVDAQVILSKGQSLTSLLNRAEYAVDATGAMPSQDLDTAIANIMASDSFPVDRVGKSETTRVDIRPAVYGLAATDQTLSMTLGIGDGGYVRPSEILEKIFGSEMSHYLAHKVHRVDMYRITETGEKIPAMDL